MGLLELYNQITNGILPTGDDKKHIDNMPLGNPQWENKNDTVTDYGNTNQITGKITPGQYPAGPIEHFTQKYDQNNTYLDQVYTNPNNNQPSPNQDSLDASRLDDQNNPNPDPTVYPNNVNGQLFTQDDWEGSEYDTKVNRNNIVDSPLTDRLGDSDEYAPDEIVGPFNFTPEYNSDREYDSVINRDDVTNSPLGSDSLNESNLDDSVIYNGPGSTTPTNIDGTFNFTPPYDEDDDYEEDVDRTSISNSPLTDRLGDSNEYAPDEIAGPFDFENKYSNEEDEEYDDIVNRDDTDNSPLYNSLDDSTLDDSVVYDGPGATTPTDVDGEFNFEPKYTSDEKYDTTISNSPLLDSLDDSTLDDSVVYNAPQTYTPDELIGTPNFTPEYNSDKEYDGDVNRDSKENSPLFEAAQYDPNLDRIPNSTTVIYNGPGDTTPDEIEGTFNFSTKYTGREGDDYNDNVGFLEDGSINSPLSNSLDDSDSSDLDDMDDYDPRLDDPTIYPIEAQSQGTAAQKYEQKYYNEADKEYDDNVKLNKDQPELSPLYNEYESSDGTPITFDDPTNYRGLSKKRSPVNGINPLEGSGSGKFNQEYNADKTYLDTISNNITIR